jgi:hypothetical protein
MVNNPAASSIPYVPSVTVTGLPQTQPPQVSTGPAAVGTNTILTANTTGGTRYQGHPGVVPLYWPGGPAKPGDPSSAIIWVPVGTQVQAVGPLGAYGVPVNYLGKKLLAAPEDWDSSVGNSPSTFVGGGSGGWGQAGSTNPIGMFGWTSGWSPVGGGDAGTILSQRAGLQTTGAGGRFDYGGAGGGSSSVNRTAANKALRPKQKLNRRMLSGRK